MHLHLDHCFFVTPISAEGTEIRVRADKAMRHLVDPIAKSVGLSVVRADKIEESGTITAQIVKALLGSKLVIADLTGANPNVFYELALRHAFLGPCVLFAEDPSGLPFDIAAERVVAVPSFDVDVVSSALESMQKQASSALEADTSLSNPVLSAIPNYAQRFSGLVPAPNKGENKALGPLLEMVSSVQQFLANAEDYIRSMRESWFYGGGGSGVELPPAPSAQRSIVAMVLIHFPGASDKAEKLALGVERIMTFLRGVEYRSDLPPNFEFAGETFGSLGYDYPYNVDFFEVANPDFAKEKKTAEWSIKYLLEAVRGGAHQP